jgi:molybdate transport system substrate-binding protein
MKYAVAFASAVSLSTAAVGAEVTVMSGGAVKSAFTEAAKAWERKTGNKVNATFAPAGELRRKIAAGESADVLIVPRENVAEFDKAGALASGSDRDLAGVAMGAAVRKGAPVPDISTPEALKRALLETKSLTYMDPTKGTSGKHFDESVLPALGIRDQVRAKTTFGEGGYIAEKVARGEVDMAFHQITEIMPVPGVTVVGPLPKELNKVTVYTASIMKGAKHTTEAQSLIDFLASPEGRQAFLDKGFSAP